MFDFLKKKPSTKIYSENRISNKDDSEDDSFSDINIINNNIFKEIFITINDNNLSETGIINSFLKNNLNLNDFINKLQTNNNTNRNNINELIEKYKLNSSVNSSSTQGISLFNNGGKRRKSFKHNLINKKYNITKKQRKY